jgi:serine/threonine protein phosphatase PrpC
VVEVQRGDTLLFCSDGLSGFLRDAQIAETLAAGGTAAEWAARLVEQVKAVQRADEQLLVQSDNVSVVVVQID